MTRTGCIVIAGDEALANFRQGLSAARAVELLRQAGGRLLAQLAVGVGKTEWLIRIIAHVLAASTEYDLVIVLSPRWDILTEILSRLPPGLNPTILRPRPKVDCGELDAEWDAYERNGLGILGREVLCSNCPRCQACSWLGQYGRLRNARLVLTMQQHLIVNPDFVSQLKVYTGAERALVLLDESDALIKSAERRIGRQDLQRFVVAVDRVSEDVNSDGWLTAIRILADAQTDDLQEGNWSFPWVSPDWAREVQRAGWEIFGDEFRFLGFDLRQFSRSDCASRERLDNGDIRCSVTPRLGDGFIVFSGSIAASLARYRLDPDHRDRPVASPFKNHVFLHPGTRWYNVRSVAGAARYFPGNASTILDFFAGMVVNNIRSNKRTLLIARKRFLQTCKRQLDENLHRLGGGGARIVTDDWDSVDLDDPRTIPLINYGVAGINRFEDFDTAYCLTGYYVNHRTLAATVLDFDATVDRFPISIRTTGNPSRRIAHVELPDGRATILPTIAQGVLDELEGNVIVQAVGRVRPFTRPREVITFHASDLPGVRYDFDFPSLAAARGYFGISTRRTAERESGVVRARLLRSQGLTHTQIAREMGVNARTVRRYLR